MNEIKKKVLKEDKLKSGSSKKPVNNNDKIDLKTRSINQQ